MRVEIWEEEYYPVFEILSRIGPHAYLLDVPDELIARYRAAMNEFHAVQDILGELMEADQKLR